MADPAALPDPLLAELRVSQQLGLIGSASIDDHVTHSLGFAGACPHPPRRAADLGPGGGLPALVLAWCWPDSEWVLIEGRERATARLEVMIARLGWTDRVRVHNGSAEEAGRIEALRESFEVVTARGFGPPPMTAECAAPLLVPGGVLIVSEPPGDPQRWPADAMAELGFEHPASVAGYMTARSNGSSPPSVPRRPGLPRRRPLW